MRLRSTFAVGRDSGFNVYDEYLHYYDDDQYNIEDDDDSSSRDFGYL